ncbi:MAG: S9 family peptidase [Phycisphaerales bacterium]|nr:MAG: S9 family peptidase [Phycisphaerales bacterium]
MQNPREWIAAAALCAGALTMTSGPALAQEPYRLPPPEVVRILDAAPLPFVSVDPSRRTMLLMERENLPPISELAQPMLRLAGVRINPNTNATHGPRSIVGMVFRDIATGEERRVRTPEGVGLAGATWSPAGDRVMFMVMRDNGVELWVTDVATGEARALTGPTLNATMGGAAQWTRDGRAILAQLVPDGRGPAPTAPAAPIGPIIQETTGRAGPVRTFQDLLSNAHDEALFDHYFTSQFVRIDADTGEQTKIGAPGVYRGMSISPSGDLLLVTRIERPYSYLHPWSLFPETTEVWDMRGRMVHHVVSQPLRDNVPIQGVPTGRRSVQWRNAPGVDTLVWAEALDGGDPRTEAEFRDRLMVLDAPFDAEPRELLRTEHRYAGLTWTEDPSQTMVSDYDRDRLWSRTWIFDFENPRAEHRLVWDRSVRDRYNAPGSPVDTTTPDGRRVVMVRDNAIVLTGAGASPEGDRPFMDRMDLATLETERLWRNEGERYEYVVDLLSDDGARVITRRESPNDPPNYFAIDLAAGAERRLTHFEDPAPELRDIRKELVTYTRDDGVELSATLHLPANYREGDRLPLLVWAYPREFNDPATAGQVSGSPWRFTQIGGSSHLFFLTQGYAIMNDATMPVVGHPETANDTFVEQIVASAQAAIDKAVEMGVADPERVGVGGHSYGAFMTAHLMAHSDLFKAGIARSGAYNRTLTPFGFQSERRTFWEAPEIYMNLSPFTHAHKITAPVLLIHGEIDNNSGTFPIQSERMYHAIQGHGGVARLVMLPHESHGYQARESVMHVLAEMIDWFDLHVKNISGSSASAE